MAIPACVADLAVEFSASRDGTRLLKVSKRLPSEAHQLLLVALLWQPMVREPARSWQPGAWWLPGQPVVSLDGERSRACP